MLTTAAKEQVIAVIVSALSPYVGRTMAGASVRGTYEKLGLGAAPLDRAQVQRLIDALAPGLAVFVGKDKGRAVVAEIWAAIDALGGRAEVP